MTTDEVVFLVSFLAAGLGVGVVMRGVGVLLDILRG